MSKKANGLTKTVRFVAFTLLERIDKGGAYSNLAIKEAIETTHLNEKDARLLTELVYGTVGNQLRLDYYLAPFLKKAKKVDRWVQCLLRMSVYQFAFLDKVPNHAIVNEAVEIAKYRGNIGIGQFVNGVLRQIQRVGVPDVQAIDDHLERVAISYSLPIWLVQALVQQIGMEATEKLGESLMKPSHVS
ncbi:MAG: 16S rRNA (cytosine(967)-C(5))-methyltransferase, partial [Lentilactobacillus parabuchneri]|nr:16S rRNA (cytosine(967)-C(5))-methyltransferase [Lentilactobacillus parabuchneri]